MMRVRQFTPIPTVTIITYHHIAERDPQYLYDPDVSDASPAQFRRQMETIARYCTPIGIDELLRAVEGGPLPKNPVMVSFDDGYRSCSDTALPILRAVGVRATFFIATSYVSQRKLYWWEKNALLLNNATKTGRLTYPTEILLDPHLPNTRKVLNDTIKNTPNLDVDQFQTDVAAALGVEWSPAIEAAYADRLMMTWDQIRALARAGMDIESHSRSHRVLQTLDDANLASELTGSREDLEAQLGRPVRAIAYPVGRRIQRELKIRRAVEAAGYRIGLSNMSGVNRMWPASMRSVRYLDPLDMRRLATDRDMSDAMYFAQVALPQMAYINYYNR